VTIFDSNKLLTLARNGDTAATGQLFDHFRPYLFVIAQRQLDGRLKGRLDPSDVLQTTFLEAHRDLPDFRGRDINSLLAWLRHILRNNIETVHQRHLGALKRSAKREIGGIIRDADGQPLPLEKLLQADTSSPSQRAMRDEAAASLALCMTQIPETQCEAIRLRYIEGLSLREISERIDKSEMAVAGLLKRGLKSLRTDLVAFQSSSQQL